MRRWEDWERSRLRKIRREEKRRREFERTHGAYIGGNGELTARSEIFSQYDGSDTVSVASSDDDHWGAQIGGYNENSTQYPPPPVSLMPTALASAETIAASDLEAMLEVGFDDKPSFPESRNMSPLTPTSPFKPNISSNAPRYQLSDAAPAARYDPYVPLQRDFSGGSQSQMTRSPTGGSSTYTDGAPSAVGHDYQGHMKKGSGPHGRQDGYGPLGPLDPGDDAFSPAIGKRF